MTLIEALSLRISELMKKYNLTQYRLSLQSGVSQSTIGDIRHQRNKTVNIHIIYEIAQGFHMELPEFFDSPLFRDGNILD